MGSSGSEDIGAPVIGLTTYREPAVSGVWDTEFDLLPAAYVDAVARAGGLAVLLPPQQLDPDRILDRLDGLLLTGGADVDPARYGAAPHPRTSVPRTLRDGWELALAVAAVRRGLPLLAVCRGLQILDVALGGSLHQHLPDVVGSDAHNPVPGVFAPVEVTLVPGTRAAALLGARTVGSCHHHQAIDVLAPDLVVSGRAADGTIEAVERPGDPFLLGVQWHPEQHGDDVALFTGLVDAARRSTASSPPTHQDRE